jgi:hypothetical protein
VKVVEKEKATASLAVYTEEVGNGPVVVTDQGKPVAILMSIENTDLETVALSMNRRFFELIERSRSRVCAEGSISSRKIRRRFA